MSYHHGKRNDKKQKGFGFSGFQMPSTHKSRGAAIPPPDSTKTGFNKQGYHAAIPPPDSNKTGFNKQGYHTMNSISENALTVSWNTTKVRGKTEEE